MVETTRRAFAVQFKDLSRWDPLSVHQIHWQWSPAVMIPIEKVLKPRKEKVDRNQFPFSELQPMTIHFDGSVDPRKVDADKEYRMDLFFAYPGDIVVAKIDLKNGAVGIVPQDWQNVVVTNHFAVYEPDRTRIIPEYFHRLIQAGFFKEHLWRNKVGAEGRKEVKLDFFEALEIPVPYPEVQREILRQWQEAQTRITQAYLRVDLLKLELDRKILQELGLSIPDFRTPPKFQAATWGDFSRWGVGFNQARPNLINLREGKYPVASLESIIEETQYGTSEKANTEGRGLPVIRMNNIVEGRLDLTRLKHVELPTTQAEKLSLEDGDILFNRTNSKELVGKCAVFHDKEVYVYASYIIRVRVDRNVAHPDFVAYLINSTLVRRQIDAISRQIIGQANINSEELSSLEIPLPPPNVQETLMAHIGEARRLVDEERSHAEDIAMRIREQIDDVLLGVRSYLNGITL